jgi:phosphatidylglycerol:prolipoprotein diacylglycerol transferase
MVQALDFPDISPILFSIGPIAIRWYSIAYLLGIFIGWFLICKQIDKKKTVLTREILEDYIFWLVVGIVLGGRFAYVLFYAFDYFIQNPVDIFKVWQGGMSFHGGLIGVIIVSFIFSRKHKIRFLELTDLLAMVAPIGLFFGRIANFINDELWGRVAYDVPWAVKFPNGGGLPRHPSQIYEALLEGVLLFVIIQLLAKNENVYKRKGIISGLFVIFYALFRMFVEQFREPDQQLGFIFGHITMGQILSFPMILIGLLVMYVANKNSKKEN